MLKVKKATYGAIPKNNKLLKLKSHIKHEIQKIEEEKNRKNKTINDYAKLIQSIKREWVIESYKIIIEKKMKKIEDRQFTTNFINHNKKQIESFEGREKRKHKKQHYVESSSKDGESEYYVLKKQKSKKKMIKKHKRSYDENENDYDNIDSTVESSEESESFGNDYEDGDGDGYGVDYKTKKGLSNYLK